MGGSARKVASGAVWSVLYNFVNAIYGFVAVPLLINYFGKAEYGLIGLAQSVNVYIQLMDMGLNSTNVRFFSVWLSKHDFPKVKKLFQTSLAFFSAVGILNAVILIVISFFSGSIFNVTPEQDIILKQLLYILAAAAILQWYSSCFDQLIRATENVDWIQKRSFIPKGLQILLLVLTVVLHFSITTYFFFYAFLIFAILPLSVTKIKKETPFVSFVPKFDWPTLKEILPYTLNIFSFHLFKFSFLYLCPVFLGILASVESVADYKVVQTVASIISMVTGVVLSSLLPSSSKVVAQENKDAYYKIAYSGTKYISMVACFCVFGMITIGRDLLCVYVGESYLYLTPWMYLLFLIGLGNHIVCLSSLILAGRDIKPLSRMVIFSSITSLVAAWFLIPHFQIGGVVIAQALYEVMQVLFYYIYFFPRILDVSAAKVLKIFVPFALEGLIVSAVLIFIPHSTNHWQNIFVFGGAFAIIYLIILFLHMNKEDRTFVLSLVNKK